MTTKRGEAAAIVPSEMKGRKRPMTDDEFLWRLERERRDYVRRAGVDMAAMTENQGPGVPDNEVLRAVSAAVANLFGDAPDSWLLDAEDVVEHLQGDGYAIVRERAIGDALSDAIMEATRQGWDDPDSAIWRRGMAAGHRTLGLVYPGEPEVGR